MVSGAYPLEDLARRAKRIRELVLRTVCQAGAGHTGGALSIVEILTVLYFRILRVNPSDPLWPERDRFVLSKGHASVALYATLAVRGYFPEERLEEFDRLDGALQGHPDMLKTPGVDMSTGSLGQGLSAGIGMALAGRALGKAFHTYVLLGDGELQEGQVWEAAMYAGFHAVPRLVAVVDYNKLQLTGRTAETLDLEPLADKWRAFRWKVLECDGHDIGELVGTLERARELSTSGPVVAIAHTHKGQGVSFIRDRVEWHARALTAEELHAALAELGVEP
jgi:transketolase